MSRTIAASWVVDQRSNKVVHGPFTAARVQRIAEDIHNRPGLPTYVVYGHWCLDHNAPYAECPCEESTQAGQGVRS